jgi:serine/threonine-protein kinase HipA
VERARVYRDRVPIATLERLRHAVRFAYDPTYLTLGRDPVATTLPLSDEPVVTHVAGALPPFFSGLLPEGRRLSALRLAAKTSADDEFTLLLAVGGDLVGDVQVVAEGDQPPSEVDPQLTVDDWSKVDFAELFTASTGNVSSVDRVGLAGVQDKLSTRMMSVPVAMRGHRYFLKLNPPEFPQLAENEAFFLTAARRSGFDTAEGSLVEDRAGATALLVRRFDRWVDASGGVRALAQEDACQLLGRYPADKYRVTTEEVVDGLASACLARPVAAINLLRQMAFAYLTCNGDAHAKNFSVQRHNAGEWRVTPAYDLPSTYPYGDTTMALSINGRQREDIGRKDFLALADAVGLRPSPVERMLSELCVRVDLWIQDLDGLPFDHRTLHKFRRAIENRRGRLRR